MNWRIVHGGRQWVCCLHPSLSLILRVISSSPLLPLDSLTARAAFHCCVACSVAERACSYNSLALTLRASCWLTPPTCTLTAVCCVLTLSLSLALTLSRHLFFNWPIPCSSISTAAALIALHSLTPPTNTQKLDLHRPTDHATHGRSSTTTTTDGETNGTTTAEHTAQAGGGGCSGIGGSAASSTTGGGSSIG
jgi:hypothetical protein